ncbi:MAG TPA: holo-ACP synthase, partial [Longimicrobiales bacterium]
MVLGTGIDLVSIPRFEEFRQRHGERGLHRLFTAGELAYCLGRANATASLAVRFAAKEAFFKALGTGMGSAGGWQDVEVIRLASGRPRLMLHGRAA